MSTAVPIRPRAAAGRADRRPAPGSGRRGRARRLLSRTATGYAYLAGGLLCFGLFSWYPMVRTVLLSFQHTNFVGQSRWVGMANFRRLLADPQFLVAWRNTFEFTGLALVIGFGIPFLVAVVLNELRHARAFFRLVVYLPVMIPPVVTALLWKWFYDPGPGLFNEILRFAHLPASGWTNSATAALPSLVLVSTWANMGGTVLIYLAALQNIPGDLYEAAELDGAGLWHRFRHVTIPQTRFVLLVLLLVQIVATMQVFTEPYIMTGGGPRDATVTVIYLIYKYAFVYFDYGAACALSLMMLAFLGAFAALYLRVTRTGD